jgi:hypothetical protein
MKPISWLRMRERSAKSSFSPDLPFSDYFPSVGVSSRPMIESNVDFPHPEGPGHRDILPLADGEIDARKCVSFNFIGIENLG